MAKAKPYTHYHKDGTVWAKGEMTGGTMTGYWEWFRKDGSKMRTGFFDAAGVQIGDWTTFAANGRVVKVTKMKLKAKAAAKKAAQKSKPKTAKKAAKRC